MGMRKHARSVTKDFFVYCADAFADSPTSGAWVSLLGSMKAYQMSMRSEEEIKTQLVGKRTGEIVDTFIKWFDREEEELRVAIEEGRARVFDARSLREKEHA